MRSARRRRRVKRAVRLGVDVRCMVSRLIKLRMKDGEAGRESR